MNSLIIPLFTLIGILISAFISWLISKNQVAAGITKVRYELQNTYVETLQIERIKQYPTLFSAVETYVKSIQNKEITFDKLFSFSNSTLIGKIPDGLSVGYQFRFSGTTINNPSSSPIALNCGCGGCLLK